MRSTCCAVARSHTRIVPAGSDVIALEPSGEMATAVTHHMLLTSVRAIFSLSRSQRTRTESLYFASHGCRGGSGFGGYGPAGYTLDTDGNTSYQGAIDKGPPGGDAMQGATDRSFNMSQTDMSATATGGGHSRVVKGSSRAYCNERPENGDPIGVMKWSFGFFRTGVL